MSSVVIETNLNQIPAAIEQLSENSVFQFETPYLEFRRGFLRWRLSGRTLLKHFLPHIRPAFPVENRMIFNTVELASERPESVSFVSFRHEKPNNCLFDHESVVVGIRFTTVLARPGTERIRVEVNPQNADSAHLELVQFLFSACKPFFEGGGEFRCVFDHCE